MNDARLAESAVSIVVNMYTGILQGIPNLLNILTESKESSYYHDILTKDIEFTQNAVTIAADDDSARFVEIKLQEKGIPFDKIPSALLNEHIKSNGRHVFLSRDSDYGRILEAVQEVKAELAPQNHNIELEIEEENELERETPEGEEGQEAVTENNPEENLGKDSEEEPEEDVPEPEGKKKKKHSTKRSERLHTPSQDSSMELLDRRLSDREHEDDMQLAWERERQRYDEENRAWEQKEQCDREYREARERELTQGQEREQQGLAESSHWESQKKEDRDYHINPDKERDHNSEQAREKNYRAERSDSQAASRDKSLNLSTGQFEQGKTTEQLRKEENWIVHEKLTEPPSARKGQSNKEQQEKAHFPSSSERQRLPHVTPGASASAHPMENRTAQQAERPALESGNIGGRHERELSGPQKQESVTVLGTGHDMAQTAEQAYGLTQRTGSAISGSAFSRQAEVFYFRQRNLEKEMGASGAPSGGHSDSERKVSPYERMANTMHGTIRVQRIDIDKIAPRYDAEHGTALGTHAGNHTKPEGKDAFAKNSNVSLKETQYGKGISPSRTADFTEDILKGRRFYQVRDVLSPNNFRNAVSGTIRVVSQSLVGRDTDSGRVANEIVDYVSPMARLAKGKFLNSGAIEIARTTHCDMDVLTAAYAVKNNMTLNDAKSELRNLRKLDASLLRNGKDGLNLANDGAAMKKIAEIYELQGQPASFIGMLRGFDNDKFASFLSGLDISDELREALLKTPVKDIDILKIDSLLKKHGGNLQDKKLLQMMRAGKLMDYYPGAGSFSVLFRRYFTQMIKELGRTSDAGRALGSVVNVSRNVYHTYRSGIRLLYTVLRKFKVVDTNSIAAQVIADPGKTISRMALSKTKSRISRSTSRLGLHSSRTVAKTKRAVNHASSALKFLKSPLAPLRNILAKNALVKKMTAFTSKLGAKFAAIAAKAGVILGWVAVIIIVIIILIEFFSTRPGTASDNDRAANYMFVQDTEIMQEVITELTAKNEAFISDINNAANHRGNYGTTAGLTADENVDFYEIGAYNIVFRDAYGNELEPSHVDLNNTKTILAMASKFLPYPFQKPSENASDEEKKAYEDIKQHFKDYCYFLWASTHQISIEEYHPGNSDGIEGAVDNSGLITTLDRGVCEQNGKTIWLQTDFTPDICIEQHCETCNPSPATGLGSYYDDLCTHGKEKNEHGGWRKTGKTRMGVNCKSSAKGREHHDRCDHSDEDYDCDPFTCSSDYYVKNCTHVEFEWVYECGGHMGSVVYVTIGELSRMPGFPAATDVDYDAVGKYGTGESISGSDVTDTGPEAEPDTNPGSKAQ